MQAQKYHLDWKMRLVFRMMRNGVSINEGNLAQTRAQFNSKQLANLLFRRYQLTSITDRTIPGREKPIPVRIYRPVAGADLPVIVYYHGGGFVLGGLDGHDAICRRLAVENAALVVSVDYRLAPEHKFPAAVDDAYDAACWVAAHLADLGLSGSKLIVMGDSAGGNLAAVVSLLARDRHSPPIDGQVLIYPAVEMSENWPSKHLYDDTPVLDRNAMYFYRDCYISQPSELVDARLSPLLAESLADLPPALVLTGEYDPLRDEGKAYAERLQASGVPTTYFCYPGMPHGFISFGWLGSQSNPAFDQIRQTIRALRLG